MAVPPLSQLPRNFDADPSAAQHIQQTQDEGAVNWLRVTAAATLVTGGALLLAGKNRLGLVAAAAGTSLAMIDQQHTLKKWWELLPGYIVEVQGVLEQVDKAVEELAAQREKISHVLGR